MKTNRIIVAALVIAAAVSCQKENFVGSENPRETEAATLVTGMKARTSLSGNDVLWTDDDKVAVFDNANVMNIFDISEANGSYALFNGSVTSGTTQIYAVYPAELAVSADGSSLKVNIPADQTSKESSFAEEHNISVAKGAKTPGVEDVEAVTFKNVCSYLKFTVPSYVSDVKSVTLTIKNRTIAGEAIVDYKGDVPELKMVQGGKNSISMTGDYSAGREFMFVLAPGEVQGCTVKVVNKADEDWTVTKTSTFGLAAGQYRNLGTLELEKVTAANAVATHTKNGDTLTGTKVDVTLDIPAATLKYVTALNLVVKNLKGDTVRSLAKYSGAISSSVTLGASDEWPYLPQGTYTVSGSYVLSGKETKEIAPKEFVSPKPSFGVTSNAYSSYTKYLNEGASAANAVTGDKIAGITSATPLISDAIMSSDKYKDLKGVFTFKLDGNPTDASEVSGLTWSAHTVEATYTFDGASCSGTTVCHVTGLPYSAPDTHSFYKSESKNNWYKVDGNKTSVSSDKLILRSGTGDITGNQPEINSSSFYIPSNINTSLSVNCNIHSQNVALWYTTTLTVKVGNSQVFSQTSGKNKDNVYNITKSVTFTPENNYINMKTSVYAVEARYAEIFSVKVSYID